MILSTSISSILLSFSLSILNLLYSSQYSLANDIFCGNLTVYQRKWSLDNAAVLVSRRTLDLKRCLHICCSLSDCQGVTFVGVVERKIAQENCMMIKCNGECQFDDKTEFSEGVSVKISRTLQNSTFDSIEATNTLSSSNSNLLSVITPIWAIGLIIVASVLCIGFNIVLISAYICWRRKKNQKRKAHISTITALHAFNPA